MILQENSERKLAAVAWIHCCIVTDSCSSFIQPQTELTTVLPLPICVHSFSFVDSYFSFDLTLVQFVQESLGQKKNS